MRSFYAAGVASVGIGSVFSVAAAIAVVAAVSEAGRRATSSPVSVVRSGRVVLTNDWHEQISQPSFWRSLSTQQRSSLGRGRDRAESEDDEERPAHVEESTGIQATAQSGSYRTVCVRLCDGYFFPISFGTTRDRFAQDAAKCESSCRAPAKLFVYPNVGGDPEAMADVEGKPYKDLPRAFVFRTKYDASCTCKPHPWEREARDLHKRYAEEAKRAPADRTAAARPGSDGTVRKATSGAALIQAAGTSRLPKQRKTRSVSAEQRPSGRRPEGAMMLGARTASRSETRRSGGTTTKRYGRRNDWRTQAFRGE